MAGGDSVADPTFASFDVFFRSNFSAHFDTLDSVLNSNHPIDNMGAEMNNDTKFLEGAKFIAVAFVDSKEEGMAMDIEHCGQWVKDFPKISWQVLTMMMIESPIQVRRNGVVCGGGVERRSQG